MSVTLPASWYRDPAVCEREREAVWRRLFRSPNLAVNVYVDGMNVERIVPVGHDVTQVVHDYFASDLSRIEATVEVSNVVLDEDQQICEIVQRNLVAGSYDTGRLRPKHEGAVAWFRRRVAAAVGGE